MYIHAELYKNFNAVHYSKNIKGINTKHGIFAYYDKMHLQGKGNIS